MGKVYKSHQKTETLEVYPVLNNLYKNRNCSKQYQTCVDKPQLENFSIEAVLEEVAKTSDSGDIETAISLLLELKTTNTNNLEIHEKLADLYLQQGDLVTAREYCQICAKMIQNSFDKEIFSIKDFRILLAEAGDFLETKKEFDKIKKIPITSDNYHQGTKLALSMATHYIADKKYKEAEELLSEYRNSYLNYISKELP